MKKTTLVASVAVLLTAALFAIVQAQSSGSLATVAWSIL